MSKKRRIQSSFVYAWDGVREAIKSEPNFRVHLIVAGVALLAGIFFQLNGAEWSVLLLTISSVIILELINTGIEALVDIASPRIHPKAKIAKDVAAAAVLGSAIVALVIGVILFFPKVMLMLGL